MNSRIFVLMLCLCTALPSPAQEVPAETDFTEGFEKLAALGLPPINSTAIWIRIPSRDSDHELGSVLAKLKGNGWIIPGTGDLPSATVPLGATESTRASRPKADPTAIDLAADVGTLIGNLRRISGEADPDYSARWVHNGWSEYGTLLIFATQLHQSGHPLLANQLATTIFQLAPDRATIVDAAVNAIADPLYDDATTSVFETSDWVEYQRSMEDLVTRFPRGWESRPVVENLILPQLRKQAAGEKPAVPTLPDIILNPAALDAIARLTVSDAEYRVFYTPWLLASEWETSSPLQELAALGLDAIPALAALLEDPYLLAYPADELETSDSYFSGDVSAEDRILLLYQDFYRPVTRGEVARAALEATLPSNEEEEDTFSSPAIPDMAALRDRALDFWKENQNASREELALAFLDSTSNQQKNLSAGILAASTDPAHHEKLETAILNSESLLSQIDTVTTYVRIRKTAAKPFVDAFAEKLRIEFEATDRNDLPWQVREAGNIDVLLKPIIALATGASPRAMARDIGRGDPEGAQQAIRELMPLLAELEPKLHLHALLEGAFAAKNAGVREEFLLATFHISWDSEEEIEEDENQDSSIPPDRIISDPEANVWKKLILDERPCASENLGPYGVKTLRQLAALALESATVPGFHQSARESSKITGILPAEFALTRAEARLSGQPIPSLPDPSKVSLERLAEIIAEVAKLPAPDIQAHIKKLGHDEQAAWVEWIADPSEPPAPPELRAHALTVLAVSAENHEWSVKEESGGGIGPGFRLTKESLAEKIEALAKDAPALSRTIIFLAPSTTLPGLESTHIRSHLPDPDADENSPAALPVSVYRPSIPYFKEAPESALAIVFVRIALEGEDQAAVWLHQEDGKIQPLDQDQADRLFKTLEAAEEASTRPVYLQIQILSRADAAIINPE